MFWGTGQQQQEEKEPPAAPTELEPFPEDPVEEIPQKAPPLDAVLRGAGGILAPVRLPPCNTLEEMRAAAAGELGGEARVLRWLGSDYVQWESTNGGGDALVIKIVDGRFVNVDINNCTIPEVDDAGVDIANGRTKGAHPPKRARRRR
jgi:hypothetical protein